MKKIIVFLLAALLMFSVAFADSVPMSKEDQMANLVKNFLEENEFPYEYDDYIFTVPFSVDNSMESAFITVYIYDDMLSVSVDAPIHGTRDVFEKMAVFTTLVNNEIYYAQFRLDLDGDEFYISCRSCNLVEDVLPGENELFYLFAMPHSLRTRSPCSFESRSLTPPSLMQPRMNSLAETPAALALDFSR